MSLSAHDTADETMALAGHAQAIDDRPVRYRRANMESGSYFFTVSLAERASRLVVERIDSLRQAVRTAKQRHPCFIDAWGMLPGLRHAIQMLPEGDMDFAMIWMRIKAEFSRRAEFG